MLKETVVDKDIEHLWVRCPCLWLAPCQTKPSSQRVMQPSHCELLILIIKFQVNNFILVSFSRHLNLLFLSCPINARNLKCIHNAWGYFVLFCWHDRSRSPWRYDLSKQQNVASSSLQDVPWFQDPLPLRPRNSHLWELGWIQWWRPSLWNLHRNRKRNKCFYFTQLDPWYKWRLEDFGWMTKHELLQTESQRAVSVFFLRNLQNMHTVWY